MAKKDLLIALFPLIIILAFVGVSIALIQWNISGTGSINNPYHLEVYEVDTTTPCDSISWGSLDQGQVATHGITVKNTGLDAFALNMTYTMSPLTVGVITWDIEGTALAPQNSVNGLLTLTLAADAPEGPFTCEIYINVIAQ